LTFLEAMNIPAAVNASVGAGRSVISLYIENHEWDDLRENIVKKLREIAGIFDVPAPEVAVRDLEEASWRDAWKRFARVYRFGSELVVKPTWRRLRKDPGCPVISIDPRMAFGTGGHASTRLCIHHLRFIRRKRPDCLESVLDVGTGSGILAIAAVLFGAGRTVATDIDPDAVRVARENAALNGVAEHIRFTMDPLREISGRFGLIMANIFESVLIELLDDFKRRLAKDGMLVVSGLLASQGGGFVEKASAAGLRKRRQRRAGSWISYVFEAAR